MKKIVFYFLLVMFATTASAQVGLHVVVSSGGSSAKAVGIEVEHTIGEPVVGHLSSPGLAVTQGFNQVYVESVKIEEKGLVGVECFPNPVSDNLVLRIPDSYVNDFKCIIIDVNGRIVVSKAMHAGTNVVEVVNLEAGNYFLTLRENVTGSIFKSKLLKLKK